MKPFSSSQFVFELPNFYLKIAKIKCRANFPTQLPTTLELWWKVDLDLCLHNSHAADINYKNRASSECHVARYY